MSVECDGAGNTAQLSAWIASHGNALASDSCSGFTITWSSNIATATFVRGCGQSGYYDVTFFASDECGNYATTVARFTITVGLQHTRQRR